jgi:hypothetical protein
VLPEGSDDGGEDGAEENGSRDNKRGNDERPIHRCLPPQVSAALKYRRMRSE